MITGTLPRISREEATAIIEANGGKTTGSISKKPDYLLDEEKAGSKNKVKFNSFMWCAILKFQKH